MCPADIYLRIISGVVGDGEEVVAGGIEAALRHMQMAQQRLGK